MRNTSIILLILAMLLLPAFAALGAGDKEAKAEFARLNQEVEGLKAKLEGGVTRDDFGAACADCHGATPKYPLLGARLGYDTSGHKNNDNSTYANGGGLPEVPHQRRLHRLREDRQGRRQGLRGLSFPARLRHLPHPARDLGPQPAVREAGEAGRRLRRSTWARATSAPSATSRAPP